MLYPKISNIKKSHVLIRSLLGASAVLGVILIVVQVLSKSRYNWALLAIAGIIYTWTSVIYAIKKNVNIAYHVMVQMLSISILMIAIDYIIGYKGWSFEIGIPITSIVANVTMLILTISSRRKYLKYVVYQVIIFTITILSSLFVLKADIHWNILYTISMSIAGITLFLSITLCRKNFIEELKKRFHM